MIQSQNIAALLVLAEKIVSWHIYKRIVAGENDFLSGDGSGFRAEGVAGNFQNTAMLENRERFCQSREQFKRVKVSLMPQPECFCGKGEFRVSG